jgi:hypothetical protein
MLTSSRDDDCVDDGCYDGKRVAVGRDEGMEVGMGALVQERIAESGRARTNTKENRSTRRRWR